MNRLLRLLFPPKCMFCHIVVEEGTICETCRKTLPYEHGTRPGTGYFSCSCSALRYVGAVREAALAMKFKGRKSYAQGFGELLAEAVRTELAGRYDIVTWVPVSRKRLRERGYDQSRLIAERMAALLGTEAVPLLRKVRDNPAQSGISEAERRLANVKGVYEVPEPERVRGKRVLVVDDILTTGATLSESARTLLMAGAEEVLAATAMRAHHND